MCSQHALEDVAPSGNTGNKQGVIGPLNTGKFTITELMNSRSSSIPSFIIITVFVERAPYAWQCVTHSHTYIDPWGNDCTVEIQMMKQGIPKHMIWGYTSEGLLSQAWRFAKKMMSRTGVKGSINPQTFISFPQPCQNVWASPVFWVKCKANHFLTPLLWSLWSKTPSSLRWTTTIAS